MLAEICNEEWIKISPELIKKLVLSINRRCREVIGAKEGHISYS